ncbi:MAG TPA: glycosyltransferase family 4 protein [Sedimentisphaerales bacterium]|nr:glycosyltransferase family 4 protein [Sedimentisphaerales bacterium]
MSRKVAIVIERADTSLGGAERSVFELAAALSARGLHVDILAAKGRTHAGNIHILCSETSGKRTSYFAFAEALKKHFSQNQYDVVHSVLPFDFADVYQPRGGTYAEATFRNAVSYQNKAVEYYKRLTSLANLRRTALLHAERKLCSAPTGPIIAALSRYVADQLKHHYATDPQRIAIIPNGVKTGTKIDTRQADALRTRILTELRLKEADNPVLFLFAANNFRLKGLVPLIKAIAADTTRPTERKSFLVVVGHGKENRYRRLARKLNILDRILFIGPMKHIHNALSIIDVAVLPTFYDPASRFILEALAAGKPVITTAFNGAIDLFTHDQHGKIIDSPDEIPALARAITHFTDTENLQKAALAITEDNLIERISINRVAGQLIALYESILQRKAKK